MSPNLPENEIIQGDCIAVLDELPENSVDVIFADPPYNLQLAQDLWRPNMTRVDAVTDGWDQFSSFEAYDHFTTAWLKACRRVLKDTGTIWVIGSYHNIFRVGAKLQDLEYWILNDVVWIKTNPMPNFRGVRFTNAHETLIWAAKHKGGKYTFNHHAMKAFNEDLQMRSDWVLPICTGGERLKKDGKKAHSTQKPEALLYRVLLSSTSPGDLVLDPFFGTGTSGAVAKKLHRRWIGIERQPEYIQLAQERIDSIVAEEFDEALFDVRDKRRHAPRIPFSVLLENGYLLPGQKLYFKKNRSMVAKLKPDSRLSIPDFEGSIHQVARHLQGGTPCNGWDHWYYEAEDGELKVLDVLRERVRKKLKMSASSSNLPDIGEDHPTN
jgi:site-specific DNA-methyltransferase (adenine-specific)